MQLKDIKNTQLTLEERFKNSVIYMDDDAPFKEYLDYDGLNEWLQECSEELKNLSQHDLSLMVESEQQYRDMFLTPKTQEENAGFIVETFIRAYCSRAEIPREVTEREAVSLFYGEILKAKVSLSKEFSGFLSLANEEICKYIAIQIKLKRHEKILQMAKFLKAQEKLVELYGLPNKRTSRQEFNTFCFGWIREGAYSKKWDPNAAFKNERKVAAEIEIMKQKLGVFE